MELQHTKRQSLKLVYRKYITRRLLWALVKGQGASAYHFINLSGVVLLNIAQDADVVAAHKVDGHTLAPVPTRAANAVDVQLTVVGQVVIDHQRHLHHTLAQSTNPLV